MNIFLLSHSSGLKGPINFFEDYLLQNKNTTIHLEHPLDIYAGKASLLKENGIVFNKIQRSGTSLLNLFVDFFYSLTLARKFQYEVFIGGNNFDTLAGIVLRTFGKKIKKIIYFSADYSENRYNNKILNAIYENIEKLVLTNSDLVISNTSRAEKKRLSLGLDKKKSMFIPNGVILKNPIFPPKKIAKKVFVYIGNVTKEHGILEFVKKTKVIIDHLTVIGQGDQWEDLRNYCKKEHIESKFFYKMGHDEAISYLQSFEGFGLAPYTLEAKWTWYASPLKVNEYIASGVPVIISSVPEIASYIKNKKLGIVYQDLDVTKMEQMLNLFEEANFYKKAKAFYNVYCYNVLYKSIPL